MKKHYILLLAACTVANAQVPNPSFEEFTGYGNDTRFWGPNPIFLNIEIPIGQEPPSEVTPTILYEPGTSASCFFNSDAHTGSRAMEIRNAYNLTEDKVLPGKMILFNEDGGSTTASGWNTGHPIPAGAVIKGLGFYYKFFPADNDVAQATLQLFNEDHDVVGTAVVTLSGTHSEYTYISSAVQFLSSDVPTFMTVEFSMTDGTSAATQGSRLVIDDIDTSGTSLSSPAILPHAFVVYPTVTAGEIYLAKSGKMRDGLYPVAIFTPDGKLVKEQTLGFFGTTAAVIDVSALSQGVYLLRSGGFADRFVKQ